MSISNPNQFPEQEISKGELVYYEGGYVARRFNQTGETLVLASETARGDMVGHIGIETSDTPTADNGITNMTIVKTSSGRHLGYAGGIAIDMDLYEFEELPTDAEHIVTIGETSSLPLLRSDEHVEEVVSTAHIARGAVIEYEKSPNYGFTVLGEQYRAIVSDVNNHDRLAQRNKYRQDRFRRMQEMGARTTGLYIPQE